MPIEAPNPINRHGQLSLAGMAALAQVARKLGQIGVQGGGASLDYSGGTILSGGNGSGSGGDGLLLAMIANHDNSTPKRYSWVEYDRVTLQPISGGQSGELNAREINGLDMAYGTLTFLISDGAGGYLFTDGGPTFDLTYFRGCDGDEGVYDTIHVVNGRIVG